MNFKFFSSDFFERATDIVAQELLGKLLVRETAVGLIVGKIVETESYTNDDPACHAYTGKTERNKGLFGSVGYAYVYFTYGMHYCFNVVARDNSVQAGGVLIRAVEPIMGIELMQQRRKILNIEQLTNGPAKLAQAFGIDKTLLGHNLMQKGHLYLAENKSDHEIEFSPRIGISKGKNLLRRFYIKDNRFVSR